MKKTNYTTITAHSAAHDTKFNVTITAHHTEHNTKCNVTITAHHTARNTKFNVTTTDHHTAHNAKCNVTTTAYHTAHNTKCNVTTTAHQSTITVSKLYLTPSEPLVLYQGGTILTLSLLERIVSQVKPVYFNHPLRDSSVNC